MGHAHDQLAIKQGRLINKSCSFDFFFFADKKHLFQFSICMGS